MSQRQWYLWGARVVWYLGKGRGIITTLRAYLFHFKALFCSLYDRVLAVIP